jgi:hypothetical protein
MGFPTMLKHADTKAKSHKKQKDAGQPFNENAFLILLVPQWDSFEESFLQEVNDNQP